MDVQKTLETRRPSPQPGNDTRIVSIDVASGTATDVPAGPGVKFDPSVLSANEIGYIRKDSDEPGIYYTSGARGPRGQVRAASWSPDGSRVVFHRRQSGADDLVEEHLEPQSGVRAGVDEHHSLFWP